LIGTPVIHDRRFLELWSTSGRGHLVWNLGIFTEGPVWFADHHCLIWSDIPASRLMRLTGDGQVSVFRDGSNHTNGISCEHSARRVTRTEVDGTVTVLADRYEDKPLNSPNDVVVRSDGSIWFTDPDYGIRLHDAGGRKEQERDNVFRLDPSTGALIAVATDFDKPNGLAFSPDETHLYIADSAITDGPGKNSHIRRFTVNDNGTLSGGEVFATTVGIPDGMRVDIAGNLWASAGAKIDVYAPDATLLGQITGFPAPVTNLAFGGAEGTQLFVTAGGSLYALETTIRGAPTP
jgi:gluconolactonase